MVIRTIEIKPAPDEKTVEVAANKIWADRKSILEASSFKECCQMIIVRITHALNMSKEAKALASTIQGQVSVGGDRVPAPQVVNTGDGGHQGR
jgi:hypothetical protein